MAKRQVPSSRTLLLAALSGAVLIFAGGASALAGGIPDAAGGIADDPGGIPDRAVAEAPCAPACAVAEAAERAVDALLPGPPVAHAPMVVVLDAATPAQIVAALLGASSGENGAEAQPPILPTAEHLHGLAAATAPRSPEIATGPQPSVPPTFDFQRVPLLSAPAVEKVPIPTLSDPSGPPAKTFEGLPVSPSVAAAAAAGGLLFVAAGLYVRLAPAALTEHPTRRRLLATVRADPGGTAGSLARALDLDYKTVQHHLRLLRRGGFVVARRSGKLERYFVAGDLPPDGMGRALALRAASARALASALERGPSRAADLARVSGISEATASIQLRRLAQAGLAAKDAEGRWRAAGVSLDPRAAQPLSSPAA